MPNYLHVYNLLQLVPSHFPTLGVSGFFLCMTCTHYQFNFHRINEMNLKTHHKLIDLSYIWI